MPRLRNDDDAPRPAREDTDLFLAGEDNGPRGFEYAPDPRRLDHGHYSGRGDSGQDNAGPGRATYFEHAGRPRTPVQRQDRDRYPGSYGGQQATFGLGPDHPDGTAAYGGAAPAPDHRGRGPKGYVRSDERIRDEIVQRLTDDDRLDASGITVQVFDGRAILEGVVERRADRHRAEDLADAVRGVVGVDNRLRKDA